MTFATITVYDFWRLNLFSSRKFHFILKSFFQFRVMMKQKCKKEYFRCYAIGENRKSQRLRQIKNISCHFHHNFVAADNYDDGFWKLLLSSLFFIVLGLFFSRVEKTIRSWQFHFCQHFISGKQRMCRKLFSVTFFAQFLSEAKAILVRQKKTVWKLSRWRIKWH